MTKIEASLSYTLKQNNTTYFTDITTIVVTLQSFNYNGEYSNRYFKVIG